MWGVREGYIDWCVIFLSNLLLLLSFSIRKHTSMAFRAILLNFLQKQSTQNHPQYLTGLSRALFSTTFLELAVYIKDDQEMGSWDDVMPEPFECLRRFYLPFHYFIITMSLLRSLK